MWNFTHQTLPSSLKISPGIWKLAVKKAGMLGVVLPLNSRAEGRLTSGDVTVIHAEMANRRQLNESKHPMRRFAKSYLFPVESLVLSWYFPVPDPGGKTHRIELLSSTHHSQIRRDSALNDTTVPSAPPSKLRAKACLRLLMPCYISSLTRGGCFKKSHRRAHTHTNAHKHVHS